MSAKTADNVFEDFFKGLGLLGASQPAFAKELTGFIDKPATMRKGGYSFCNTLTFKLMPKVTRENAYRLKDALESWTTNQEIRTKYDWMRSGGIFVSVESPPWRKPHLTLGNRAREILVRHGIDKSKMKVEFRPPCRIYRKDEDGEAVLPEVFKHDKKGWHLVSETEFNNWGCEGEAHEVLGELDD